jgi:hypothetical protein
VEWILGKVRSMAVGCERNTRDENLPASVRVSGNLIACPRINKSSARPNRSSEPR